MKKHSRVMLFVAMMATICFLISMMLGCATPAKIASKSGAQLWGENCQRCHNIPSPTAFKGDNWEVVGTHMEVRANLTEIEKDKIVEFLRSN